MKWCLVRILDVGDIDTTNPNATIEIHAYKAASYTGKWNDSWGSSGKMSVLVGVIVMSGMVLTAGKKLNAASLTAGAKRAGVARVAVRREGRRGNSVVAR
jgi:hypothetical protein